MPDSLSALVQAIAAMQRTAATSKPVETSTPIGSPPVPAPGTGLSRKSLRRPVSQRSHVEQIFSQLELNQTDPVQRRQHFVQKYVQALLLDEWGEDFCRKIDLATLVQRLSETFENNKQGQQLIEKAITEWQNRNQSSR